MTQMTTDRIYRHQKYYIKYDGAIRACKVVYYKASIDCDFENRDTHVVINIAGIGNVYFHVENSTRPTNLCKKGGSEIQYLDAKVISKQGMQNEYRIETSSV